jgi:hypothetical protein
MHVNTSRSAGPLVHVVHRLADPGGKETPSDRRFKRIAKCNTCQGNYFILL